MMNNKIPVIKSYKTKLGHLTVVCESKDTLDKLKDLVSATNEDIILTTPQEKPSAITIVGLSKEYKKEEIFQMLPIQNDYRNKFAVSNNTEVRYTTTQKTIHSPIKYLLLSSLSPRSTTLQGQVDPRINYLPSI